jgi:hypothetical protein
MPDPIAAPFAAQMTKIHRILRWIAILVPLALLAMVSVDGISLSDIGVVAFVNVILWLFVFLTGFAADALGRTDAPQQD